MSTLNPGQKQVAFLVALDQKQNQPPMRRLKASLVSPYLQRTSEAEGMGFEPGPNLEGTHCVTCTCAEGQRDGAANALQNKGSHSQLLATIDTDLQRVIAAWDGLPIGIKKAVIALLDLS